MHRVRGTSGDVLAREPGFPPDLSPRAPPSPPVSTLVGVFLSVVGGRRTSGTAGQARAEGLPRTDSESWPPTRAPLAPCFHPGWRFPFPGGRRTSGTAGQAQGGGVRGHLLPGVLLYSTRRRGSSSRPPFPSRWGRTPSSSLRQRGTAPEDGRPSVGGAVKLKRSRTTTS